jgi:hypothetical protein
MRREKLVPELIMAIEAQQAAEAFHLAPDGFRYPRRLIAATTADVGHTTRGVRSTAGHWPVLATGWQSPSRRLLVFRRSIGAPVKSRLALAALERPAAKQPLDDRIETVAIRASSVT